MAHGSATGARKQVNLSVAAPTEERLRMLADASARDLRSLSKFALVYIKHELQRDADEQDRLGDHTAAAAGREEPYGLFLADLLRSGRSGDRKQINIVPAAWGVDGDLAEVEALVEKTTGMVWMKPTTLRAAFTAWLAAHTDDSLLNDLGTPQPRSA